MEQDMSMVNADRVMQIELLQKQKQKLLRERLGVQEFQEDTAKNIDLGTLGVELETYLSRFLNGKTEEVEQAARQFGLTDRLTFQTHLQYLLSCVDESFASWQKDDKNDPYQIRSKLTKLGLATKSPDTRFDEIIGVVESVACKAQELPTVPKFTEKCIRQPISVTGGDALTESDDEEETVTYHNREYKVRYSKKGAFIVVDGKRMYLQ